MNLPQLPETAMPEKNERNRRVQRRLDELGQEGKHGYYETIFRVVREEVEIAQREAVAAAVPDAPTDAAVWAMARKMADIFDYPWGSMPLSGRQKMFQNVKEMIAAAPVSQVAAAVPEQLVIDKIKVLADEYASRCSEFARSLALGKPDDSMSPVSSVAGDARMALHESVDFAFRHHSQSPGVKP